MHYELGCIKNDLKTLLIKICQNLGILGFSENDNSLYNKATQFQLQWINNLDKGKGVDREKKLT